MGRPGRADLLHGKVPVGRLLREQARMLEVHGLDLKGQILIVDAASSPAAASLSQWPPPADWNGGTGRWPVFHAGMTAGRVSQMA